MHAQDDRRSPTLELARRWCPGDAFFHALEHALGHLPVWAEDLGLITPEVEKLRDDFDFPGMEVLQPAFDDKGLPALHLLHRHA